MSPETTAILLDPRTMMVTVALLGAAALLCITVINDKPAVPEDDEDDWFLADHDPRDCKYITGYRKTKRKREEYSKTMENEREGKEDPQG